MDYETAPVGVSHMPQFAWELVSDKKNVKQKSYELQIAKDADFTDLIYNSGKTESEESAHVYAEGASLESGKRYFVRAKASDGQEETDWSETASFVTALAGKNGEWEEGAPAWKAPFVSAETDDSYKNVSKGTYVRGTFARKQTIWLPKREALHTISHLNSNHNAECERVMRIWKRKRNLREYRKRGDS